MNSKLRICPGCGFDLRGDPIPEKYFVHDKESDAHKRYVRDDGRCVCLPYGDLAPEDRFFWRTIGIEISGVYDGILFWQCPSCGAQWHRWSTPDMQKKALEHMTNFVPTPKLGK